MMCDAEGTQGTVSKKEHCAHNVVHTVRLRDTMAFRLALT
jgi:hypothetical protein